MPLLSIPSTYEEYPSSDGEPMAETEVHADEMVALRCTLQHHFRAQSDAYVSTNHFVYYEEGNPRACFAPDVYVVFGVPKLPKRRVYKLWEEKVAPAFVLELSSQKTWLEDVGNKKALCARLGVVEYWLFDPEADVIQPPLQGYRLIDGDYARIKARADGAVPSAALGLVLSLDRELRVHCVDAETGTPLLRPAEVYLERERQSDELAQKTSRLRQMGVVLAEKDAALAQKEAELAAMRERLAALDTETSRK
ncbi:MAG: Uma2 family endonuclease [Myxococcota bacterium]